MVITASTSPPTLTRSLTTPSTSSGPTSVEPRETFVATGTTGDKVKGALVVLGTAAIGLGLGVYAGLSTGILAGLAGAVAGACGGTAIAAHSPGQKMKLGALAGALTGAILGASYSSPILASVMGMSGATLPYAGILAVFSGAS
ncbi:hypothetical protein DYH09_26950 [bacterium CPR1]|nr:hypothetical protein [bacterium CPR1]